MIRARLLDTPIADRIWRALPLYAPAVVTLDALTFQASFEVGGAERGGPLARGDLAVAVSTGLIFVALETPPDPPVPCTVWARALDDVAALATVGTGDRVALLEADS